MRLVGLSSSPKLHLLSNPTLLLCLVGVLLPNGLSIGALLTGIGTPPRTPAGARPKRTRLQRPP